MNAGAITTAGIVLLVLGYAFAGGNEVIMLIGVIAIVLGGLGYLIRRNVRK